MFLIYLGFQLINCCVDFMVVASEILNQIVEDL